jgi:hypothetical protein
VALTVFGVVLVFWQAMLAERSQVAADKAASELRSQVSVLYQGAMNRRPTQEEIDGLARRVDGLRSTAKLREPHDVVVDSRLLAAEIKLFAAERARAAPRVEILEASVPNVFAPDKTASPSHPAVRTEDELFQLARSRFLSVYFDPRGQVGFTEAEKRWFARNKDAVQYDHETLHLCVAQFGLRLSEIVEELHKRSAVDERFRKEIERMALPLWCNGSRSDQVMDELVFHLDGAAEQLLKRWQGY